MVKFLGLIIFLTFSEAWAKLGACPEQVEKDEQIWKAYDYLQSLEGRHSVGSCQLEIHVCDSFYEREQGDTNQLVAELLVTDKEGFERYVPFYVNEFKNRNSKHIIFKGNRVLAYRFRDWNQDPATGRFERWDVEIFKKDDLVTVDYMEVGYNSETERNSEAPKYWISCGTEFEEYIRTHPVKYRVRSWWWWMTHPGSW